MPEPLTQQPPPGTPPPATFSNPVIGPVTSAIERDMVRQQTAQHNALSQVQTLGGNNPVFANALDAARANDRASTQAANTQQPLQPPANQQQQPAATNQQGEPLLQSRTQRQQKNLRANDWKTVTGENETLRARLAELERNNGQQPAGMQPNGQPTQSQQVAQPQAADIKTHADYVALKQERDAFYEEIKHVRVEADPEFRAKFDTKRDAAIRIAKSVAGGAGDDIARILAINDPDVRQSQLADRIKDFSEGSKQRIIAANAALVGVDVEREMEIQSRKASWEATKGQREQSEQARVAQQMRGMEREFDAVYAKWSDPETGMPFLYDDKVRARVEPLARQVFNGNTTAKEMAEATLKAAMFPEVVRSWQHALAELERLQGSNAAYRSSYPGSDNGGYANGNGQQRENGTVAPINHLGYDRPFANGLEEARARDAAANR